MTTEDQRFVPGDWLIHDGPSSAGDRSFAERAVRLLEENSIYYLVEHISASMGKRYEITLWKHEWPKFVLATEGMKKRELGRLYDAKYCVGRLWGEPVAE